MRSLQRPPIATVWVGSIPVQFFGRVLLQWNSRFMKDSYRSHHGRISDKPPEWVITRRQLSGSLPVHSFLDGSPCGESLHETVVEYRINHAGFGICTDEYFCLAQGWYCNWSSVLWLKFDWIGKLLVMKMIVSHVSGKRHLFFKKRALSDKFIKVKIYLWLVNHSLSKSQRFLDLSEASVHLPIQTVRQRIVLAFLNSDIGILVNYWVDMHRINQYMF